ncbi:MAG: hypothetical protein BHV67_15585 [Bacteroidales bacterium 43_36]|jgi:hypothetical protein|nr:MAG: hypothetical protein BHV67_15585 [Bacteroidales bacterium 43_36]
MRVKIVYVLISNKEDIYLEQLWLSLYTLRLYNKEAHVAVVMDDCTNESLNGYRSKILDFIDEKIVITPPVEFDNKFRSRYIKIQLRQFVEGDYLFVDTDTIIVGSLDEIDDYITSGFETGMALDGHRKTSPYHRPDKTRLKTLGWDKLVKNGENYYNTGVILMKDSAVNHRISELWYKNWQYEITKGIHYDQVALLYTLKTNEFVIKELPGEWNCQVTEACAEVIEDSKILHYFNIAPDIKEKRNTFYYYFSSLDPFKRIKETEDIPEMIKVKARMAKYEFCVSDDKTLKSILRESNSILHKFYLYYPGIWDMFEAGASVIYKIAKRLYQ